MIKKLYWIKSKTLLSKFPMMRLINLQCQLLFWRKKERLLNSCLLNQSLRTPGPWKSRKLKMPLISIWKLMRMKTMVLPSSNTSLSRRGTRKFFKQGGALCVMSQSASLQTTRTLSRCLRQIAAKLICLSSTTLLNSRAFSRKTRMLRKCSSLHSKNLCS